MSFQSRCPCSASITTQSRPRPTAISVRLGDSSVTHNPKGGTSAASLLRKRWRAAGFIGVVDRRGAADYSVMTLVLTPRREEVMHDSPSAPPERLRDLTPRQWRSGAA